MNLTSLIDAIANFAKTNGLGSEIWQDPFKMVYHFTVWRDEKQKWTFAITYEMIEDSSPTDIFKQFVNLIPAEVWMQEPIWGYGSYNTGGYIPSKPTKVIKKVDLSDYWDDPLSPAEFPTFKEAYEYMPNAAPGIKVPSSMQKLESMFNLKQEVACPVADCPSPIDTLRQIIIHLNDSHKWNRARVADWLETAELDIQKRAPKPNLNV